MQKWSSPVGAIYSSFRELRTFHGGIDTAQSLPRCPCKVARLAFSSSSSVTPIQSIYESTRLVTCSASAGDDAPEDGKYFVSTLIPAMETVDGCDYSREGEEQNGDCGPSVLSRRERIESRLGCAAELRMSSSLVSYLPSPSFEGIMTDIECGRSPTMAKAVVLCHHGYPVVRRTSRRPHSYGRSVHSHSKLLPDPTR
jgi:hypothetical protein